MELGLSDRAAVVTGASRGIGRAIARRLLAEGARVLITGRDAQTLDAAVDGLGEGAAGLRIDVSDSDAGERVLTACEERFGGLDVLVNSAGGNDAIPLEQLTDEEFRSQLEIHVMAPWRLMRIAAPHMAQRGWGRIVNIASTSGRRPGSNNVAYGVSKAAELSLSRAFAEHYATHGVLVNAVNPGPIGGELWEAPGGLAEQLAGLRGTTAAQVMDDLAAGLPRRALGSAEEIAAVVTFLCSERAANVVGAAWSVDGGAVPSIF